MIIFPAVDLQRGRAVRLQRGRYDKSTEFFADPVQAALHWQGRGARWLHVVDLDGAFDGKDANDAIVRRICAAVDIPVQVGGGIRNVETADRYLEAGAARLIIGSLALEDPSVFKSICQRHPGRIGVSLDAENGRLKSRGWVRDTGLLLDEVLADVEAAGAAFIVYTDINRDGMQSGVNLEAVAALAAKAQVPVIAAGGVASMDDIRRLHALSAHANLAGAISGRALYEGTLDLAEAIAWLEQNGRA